MGGGFKRLLARVPLCAGADSRPELRTESVFVMTSGWYDAIDRVRAYWTVNGSRAEVVAAGILLVLAVVAFGVTAVLP